MILFKIQHFSPNSFFTRQSLNSKVMKLRLRSLETKETLRIEVPNTCSIQHLKDLISQQIPLSSYSSSSVHFSLNRKEELQGSSPQDTLQSLGITSGDLIFFTLNPNSFSSETLIVQSHTTQVPPISVVPQNSEQALTLELNSEKEQTLILDTHLDLEAMKSGTQKGETSEFGSVSCQIKPELDQTLEHSGTEDMDVDDDGSMVEVGKSFSVPCFLRKVFRKEVGDGGGRDHKLLVIAIHAVLIESGFVGFDSVSKMIIDGFHLPDEWPSHAFTMTLSYTLPDIVSEFCTDVNNFGSVVLKFQSLGKFFNIYGCLANNGSGLYRVCLDEDRLVPFLNVVWANCDSGDEVSGKEWQSDTYAEKEVFEFWKIVKDRLALPLLIDLCEQAGLAPPPCFMRLPTDLKLKILESLPGVDLAKVGCVCSELLYLSSNEDLWRRKFTEQFGDAGGSSQGGIHWKEKFAKSWESRKKRKISGTILRRFPNVDLPFFMPVRRDPNPLGIPGIIGGDHDRLPALGIPFPPLGQGGRAFPRFPARRNFVPHCNLGGPNAFLGT